MGDIERDSRGYTYLRVSDDFTIIQKLIGTNKFREVYTTNYLGLEDKKDKQYKDSCWIKVSEKECAKIQNI